MPLHNGLKNVCYVFKGCDSNFEVNKSNFKSRYK